MRAGLGPAPRRPTGGLVWWAATWGMLDWHIGMVEGPEGEPRERLSPADALTLARLWLVPLLSAAESERGLFMGLVAFGGASDLADGRLARRFGPTRLGRDLDTVADISFFATAVSAATRAGWLDRRAAWALGARYAAGLGFQTLHYFLRAKPPERDALEDTRWATPPLVSGLVLAAGGREPAGSTLVASSSLAALAWGLRGGLAALRGR